MCGGGSSKKAAQQAEAAEQRARQEAADREARIQQGQANIDRAFGQYNDDYYDQYAKSIEGYQRPQIDEQYGEATGKVTATPTTVVGSTITKKITFSITGTSGSSTTVVTAWSISETTSGNTCNNIGSSSSSSSSVYCIWGEYQNRVKSHSEDDDNHSEEHVKLADESSDDVPDFGYILVKHER